MQVLDTDRLPPRARRSAFAEMFLATSAPAAVRIDDRDQTLRAVMAHWDLGGLVAFRADVSGGLSLHRTARHARGDHRPVAALSVQRAGTGRNEQFGSQQVVPAGALMVVDISAPYTFAWKGPGSALAVHLPVDQVGLPVDVVRAAAPLISASPVYPLVRAHFVELAAGIDRLAHDPASTALATASIQLTRALFASVVPDARGSSDVLTETLLLRIRTYVRQHLTDPGMNPATIAAAHAISVRRLYQVCESADLSLEQWIIGLRLDGARSELAAPVRSGRSIAAVGRRWGFTNPSFFARRFRQAYGVTPREWHRAGDLERGGPVPGPRTPGRDS